MADAPTHVAASRRDQLTRSQPLDPPPWLRVVPVPADDLDAVLRALRDQVERQGLGVVQPDRQLSGDELRTLASAWGRPIEEHDPTARRFTEGDVLLHLVSAWPPTSDVARQPFSASPILLHTEGSRRPADAQPRYLLFDCVAAGPPAGGGQTVVVPVRRVIDGLDSDTRRVLSTVRYAGTGMPPVLRMEADGPVLSFRDFGLEAPHFVHPPTITADAVANAVDALLAALYDPVRLFGLTWAPHQIVILDNRRIVHGRTALVGRADATPRRHLRRIRIGVP